MSQSGINLAIRLRSVSTQLEKEINNIHRGFMESSKKERFQLLLKSFTIMQITLPFIKNSLY